MASPVEQEADRLKDMLFDMGDLDGPATHHAARRLCREGALWGAHVDAGAIAQQVAAERAMPSATDAYVRDVMGRRRKPGNVDPSIVCRKCGNRTCYRFQRQTRSGDEGATPMVCCETCQRVMKE